MPRTCWVDHDARQRIRSAISRDRSHCVVERTWGDFAKKYGLDINTILAYSHGRPTRETVAKFAPSNVDIEA